MFTVIWVWRRLVARYLGVVEAAGSNPVTQTNQNHALNAWYALALQGHNTDLCLKAH